MEFERTKAGKLKVSRRVFTVEYKAEVVRHKKAENLSFVETGKKFDVLPKLVQQWEKLYESGQLTAAAGRRTVSPEQAEIARMRAENSRLKMEVSILKKAAEGSQYAAHETQNYLQNMGYRQSMSGTGNCFDNAPMESFWHSLKVEEIHGRGFETRE